MLSENSERVSSKVEVGSDEDFKKPKQRRRKKKPSGFKECFGFCDFFRTAWRLFKEFSADTSIHGIKYLTDKKLRWHEKFFWFVALSLSITVCSYLIYDSFRKWQMAPVIVSFSEKFLNIWEIPFAAVTICPTAGVSPLNENYTNNGIFSNALNDFPDAIDSAITNVTWRNSIVKASDMFTEIATDEGICYTFNMMNFDDVFADDVIFEAFDNLKNRTKMPQSQWDLQGGYNTRDPNVYPQRAAGFGEHGGLEFDIVRNNSEIRSTSSTNKGFKIVVHPPCEIPQFHRQYYRLPLRKSGTLILQPSLIDTEELKKYDFNTRQCYFEEEKKLSLFKKYTRLNCQFECLVEFTRRQCHCVHFSMPRLKDDKICDLNQSLTCVVEAKTNLMQQNMENSLKMSKSNFDHDGLACGCLPACTSLQYLGEISHDEIVLKKKHNKTSQSSFTVFFKDDDFIYSKRSELYSFTDFIANFGGIMGLFLGVSILSFVEILYFMAFRNLDERKEKSDSRRPSVIGEDSLEVLERNGH